MALHQPAELAASSEAEVLPEVIGALAAARDDERKRVLEGSVSPRASREQVPEAGFIARDLERSVDGDSACEERGSMRKVLSNQGEQRFGLEANGRYERPPFALGLDRR